LIAGIHGDEVEGPFALQYLARTLARDQLSGMLVMVLCANPTAMAQGQRLTPEDGQDLNRVFPGDPRGSVSHRLAAALFGLVREADFLMTLHSWYSSGEVLPYVEYPIAGSAAAAAGAAAARACGLERIMPCDWHPGLLPAAADRIGIPAIEVEIGGLGQRTQHGQEIYATVLLRFLRHAGILPSVPDVPSPARTIGGQHLTAQASGLLCLDVKLGEQVQSGQRLGAIMNLERRTQAEVIAPTEGEIGALRRFAPVRALDHVATIFQSAIH
jgi:predicted deacylase